MRLVDGEQGDVDAVEQGQEAPGQQALGRDVQQVELAGEQLPFDVGSGVCIESEELRKAARTPSWSQRFDLVLHQRDQRRHHDRRAGAQQRRDLVAQRLAAAGGHQHQAIAAADQVLDDRLLFAAEAGMAEDAAQQCRGRGKSSR